MKAIYIVILYLELSILLLLLPVPILRGIKRTLNPHPSTSIIDENGGTGVVNYILKMSTQCYSSVIEYKTGNAGLEC